MSGKPRLVYAWPTGGYPKPAFVNSLSHIRMGQTLADHGPRDIMCTSAPVQMARTQILIEALRGKCVERHDHAEAAGANCKLTPYDYCVMHDDDIEIGNCPAGNPIDNSIAILEAHPDVGLIGALYMRESPEVPTFMMRHPGFDKIEHCQGLGGIPDKPFHVHGIGFGWVMVRMAAVRKLYDLDDGPLVRFGHFTDIAGLHREVGEDYDFCNRLHEQGYGVVADPRYQTSHWKKSGVLKYEHDAWEEKCNSTTNPIVIETPEGGKLIEINGITCLDISQTRINEAAAKAKAIEERAAKAAVGKSADEKAAA